MLTLAATASEGRKMATQMAAVLKHVRHVIGAQECDPRSDSQLLTAFVAERDEVAFAALLHRHALVVMRVCWQVLQNVQDAEDAFQATFLVLARKAASIRQQDSLAGWLHRVALNIARSARVRNANLRALEKQAGVPSQPMAESVDDWLPLLHEEVAGLPEKYRVAIVLCYFQARTHEEAALELRWPLGTVKGRLARGRDLLRTRLERRGLVLSAGAIAGALTHHSVLAQAPAALLEHTLQAAVCFACGVSLPAGTVSADSLALAQGALSAVTSTKLMASIVALVGAALFVVFSLLAATIPNGREFNVANPPVTEPPAANVQPEPLPKGVRARMGSPRFRHGGPVWSMAYVHGGKILATGGPIGTRRQTGIGRIRLWDVATGTELRQFHVQGAALLAASPDGKVLASASERDGVVFLWDAATGKELRQLKCSRSGFEVLPIAFSGDGKKLVAGGHEVRMWEVETGKLLHSLKGQPESVIALAFSADSKILALKHGDQVPLRVFQVEPWKELASPRPKSDVDLLAFAPDKHTLALTTERGGSIVLHDASDGRLLREIQAHQVGDPQRPANFSLTRQEARELQAEQILDVFGQKRIAALAYSPDGKTLASAATDKTIRLWDVATGKERQSFPADSYATGSLAFAPDGKSLAWANSAGLIRIWDLQTGKSQHGHEGHQGVVTSVALHDGGKTLITAGADATIRFWDAATGKEMRRFDGHQGPIASIHLSPDGKTLASVSPADRTVRVWELAGGKELRRFRASNTYCDAAWLPDSRTLVIRRYLGDSTVHFCDIATGKETLKFDNVEPRDGMNYPANVEAVHHGGVLGVSPNGKTLVTSVSFMSPSFHLWDIATGKELPNLWPDPRNHPIVRIAVFTADSKSLVIGSGALATVDLWEIATRKMRPIVSGHVKAKDPSGEEHDVPTYLHINTVALSPDGRTLATAGGDPIIRLWDVVTGKERRLEGHRGVVTSLAWSADGNTLASGSHDGTALVWDVSGRLIP